MALEINPETNQDWKELGAEPKGVMPKVWLGRGTEQALFKYTDDPVQNERKIQNELETCRIATAHNIKCAKIERLNFKDTNGFISYTVHTEPDKYLYTSAKQYAAELRESDSPDKPNLSFGGISVEYVQKHLPAAEKDLVNTLYLDCLWVNDDRHGDNWHLKIDRETGQVVGLSGIFDNDNAFRPTLELEKSGCAIRYSEGSNNNQKDMFKKLSADYPSQIGELLNKSRELADAGQLPELCVNRLGEMEKRYAICKNLKRTSNRETTSKT